MVVPTTSSLETICTSKKRLEPRHDDVHCAVARSCMTVFSKWVWQATEIKEYDMVRKILFIALQCTFFVPVLLAWSPASETFWIQSELDEPIIMYCEFQYKEENAIQGFPTYWYQFMAGIEIKCDSLGKEAEKETYKSKARIRLINFTPKPRYLGSIAEDLEVLAKIPLEQKLKELFKTLVISDAKGKVLLTLEDFSKARVEVGPNSRTYDIIIGEYLYQ